MALTNSTTDFLCDICNTCNITTLSAKRVNGIGVGSDGLILKTPILAKIHICNLCLAGLARLHEEKKEKEDG